MVECEYRCVWCVSVVHQSFNRYMVECECFTENVRKDFRWGFNRYMVECELAFNNKTTPCFTVLIDTWWNVNVREIEHNLIRYGVLIDTWWNVNFTMTRSWKL